jgi:ERF superfamily
MTIYKALNEIMKELPAIPKERRLEFNGKLQYNFRGVDDIYAALQPLLMEYGVTTVPSATLVHQEQVETTKEYKGEVKTSVTNRVVLSVEYTFYALDGSSIVAKCIGEGMDNGDKASNKAMSAAHKYALLQVFCIPTEEAKDSENEDHEIKPKSRDVSQPPEKKSTTSNPSKTPSGKSGPESSINTHLGDYVVTFGKFKNRTIADVAENEGPEKISSYIQWMENDAKTKKKPMNQAAKDFIEAFDAFIGNSELDKALDRPMDKSVEDQLSRLKNQFPGVPGPKMPTPYKDDSDELNPPFDPDEEIPF